MTGRSFGPFKICAFYPPKFFFQKKWGRKTEGYQTNACLRGETAIKMEVVLLSVSLCAFGCQNLLKRYCISAVNVMFMFAIHAYLFISFVRFCHGGKHSWVKWSRPKDRYVLCSGIFCLISLASCLQCFYAVGWVACKKLSGGVLAWLCVWARCRFAYSPADTTATHCLLLH